MGQFAVSRPVTHCYSIADKILFFRNAGTVHWCFLEALGLYWTVNCMAPSAPCVAQLSSHLSTEVKTMSFGLGETEMDSIQKVSFQTLEYFVRERACLNRSCR